MRMEFLVLEGRGAVHKQGSGASTAATSLLLLLLLLLLPQTAPTKIIRTHTVTHLYTSPANVKECCSKAIVEGHPNVANVAGFTSIKGGVNPYPRITQGNKNCAEEMKFRPLAEAPAKNCHGRRTVREQTNYRGGNTISNLPRKHDNACLSGMK